MRKDFGKKQQEKELTACDSREVEVLEKNKAF